MSAAGLHEMWKEYIRSRQESKEAYEQANHARIEACRAALHLRRMEELRLGNKWLSDVVSKLAQGNAFDEQPAFLRSEETKWEPTRE